MTTPQQPTTSEKGRFATLLIKQPWIPYVAITTIVCATALIALAIWGGHLDKVWEYLGVSAGALGLKGVIDRALK